MLKNWKTGTGYALLLWLLIFVEVAIVMFTGASESGQRFLHLVFLIPLAAFCTWMYFKNVKPNGRQGLYLGIWFLLVGTVLDLAITIPFFVKDFAGFYLNGWIWFGYLELLVITTVTGGYLQSKKGSKK
ncbi:MAG: hypothetical protein ABIH82_04690 [Candidatus Woesearchaeota archaeon]